MGMTQNTNTAATFTPALDRAKARVARYSTSQLVAVLVILDAQESTRENAMIREWLISEVERRFPAASEAVEAAFYASEVEAERTGEPAAPVDYVAVLVANIPQAALA
jgi:hypothetical protein